MTVKAIIRPRTKARLARYVANITQGSDLGDFNGFTPASYNGDTSSTTNGDVQEPDDDGAIYRRVAGSWFFGGAIGGLVESDASMVVYSPPGDDILSGTPVRETGTDHIFTYNGSSWDRAEAFRLRLAEGVTGDDLTDGLTEEVATGSYAETSGKTRITCASGQAVVLSYTLATGLSADADIQAMVRALFTEISAPTDDYAYGVGLSLSGSGDIDLTSGQWVGDSADMVAASADYTVAASSIAYSTAGVGAERLYGVVSDGASYGSVASSIGGGVKSSLGVNAGSYGSTDFLITANQWMRDFSRANDEAATYRNNDSDIRVWIAAYNNDDTTSLVIDVDRMWASYGVVS